MKLKRNWNYFMNGIVRARARWHEQGDVIYVWIYENRVNFSTTHPPLFPEIHNHFQSINQSINQSIDQSINHRHSVTADPTRPACLCVAGWLRSPKPAQQGRRGLSYKENDQFLAQKASLRGPLHPSGFRPLGLAWYQLVARYQLVPWAVYHNPPWPQTSGFSSARQAWLLAVRRKSSAP